MREAPKGLCGNSYPRSESGGGVSWIVLLFCYTNFPSKWKFIRLMLYPRLHGDIMITLNRRAISFIECQEKEMELQRAAITQRPTCQHGAAYCFASSRTAEKFDISVSSIGLLPSLPAGYDWEGNRGRSGGVAV